MRNFLAKKLLRTCGQSLCVSREHSQGLARPRGPLTWRTDRVEPFTSGDEGEGEERPVFTDFTVTEIVEAIDRDRETLVEAEPDPDERTAKLDKIDQEGDSGVAVASLDAASSSFRLALSATG